jgi:hypothetical protein
MAYGGSFAGTEATVERDWNGKKLEKPITLHAGDVVRMNDWTAFADSVILGFNEDTVRLSRPYVYASGVGTTGPTALLGAETYEVPASQIVQFYKVVENDGHRKT